MESEASVEPFEGVALFCSFWQESPVGLSGNIQRENLSGRSNEKIRLKNLARRSIGKIKLEGPARRSNGKLGIDICHRFGRVPDDPYLSAPIQRDA